MFDSNKILKNNFIRFCLVGLMNTLIDWGVYNVVIISLSIKPLTLLVLVAKVSGFFVAVIFSFLLNRHWTFRKLDTEIHSHHWSKQFTRFILVSLTGLLINSLIVYATVLYLNHFANYSDLFKANLAFIVATSVTMFWSFFSYKYLVFKKKSTEL